MNSTWFKSSAHSPDLSLNIVRTVISLILITHPMYALMHPADVHGFGLFLGSHGFPAGIGLAWAILLLQVLCSLFLLARKLVIPACIGHIAILSMGIVLVHAHAPSWRTVGLPDGDQQPGPEFSVLLITCLAGVAWANWPKTLRQSFVFPKDESSARVGLEMVRIAAPLILIVHPLGGLLEAFRDPKPMNDLGLYFASIGYPFGVALVWAAMYLQATCSIALLMRRFVVPACLGHIYVLGTGIWLFHAPNWFVIGPTNVIGPGKEGMEYSILLISCFVSLIVAYWPRQGAADPVWKPGSTAEETLQ